MGRKSKQEIAIEAAMRKLSNAYDALLNHQSNPIPDPFMQKAKYNDYMRKLDELRDKADKARDELSRLENPK